MSTSEVDCYCGSKVKAKLCCLTDQPPVVRRFEGFNSLDINASLINEFEQIMPLQSGTSISISLRKPQQIDMSISSLLDEIIRILSGSNINENNLKEILGLLENLTDVLHSVRYHKRQFIYRLKMLQLEEQLLVRPVTGNVRIILEDYPLQFELEAFISKLSTALDVLAKIIGKYLREKCDTHGKLIDMLKRSRGNQIKSNLLLTYEKNAQWIREFKGIRNSVQHDGEITNYRSFEYEKGIVSQPKLYNITAQHSCFAWWKSLIELVRSVFQYLVIEQH